MYISIYIPIYVYNAIFQNGTWENIAIQIQRQKHIKSIKLEIYAMLTMGRKLLKTWMALFSKYTTKDPFAVMKVKGCAQV